MYIFVSKIWGQTINYYKLLNSWINWLETPLFIYDTLLCDDWWLECVCGNLGIDGLGPLLFLCVNDSRGGTLGLLFEDMVVV